MIFTNRIYLFRATGHQDLEEALMEIMKELNTKTKQKKRIPHSFAH